MGSTKVCMKCGKDIPAEFVYCPFCGADQTKKLCKRCGAVLLNGASYCGICGEKVECDVPEFNAETVCYVSTEEHAENVVCAHEHDEIVSSQTVISTDEKTESDGISKKNKKQCKRGGFDKTKILSIVKSAIILVFCIIMFVLAFCPTAKFKMYLRSENIGGQTKIDYLSAVDGIKLMNATARHYKDGKDDVKIDKLERKLYEFSYEFESKLSGCYNEKTGRYEIDADTAKVIRKFVIAEQAYELSFDEESGSTASNNAIVFGLSGLLYILFASSMLICAIVNFVATLTKKGKCIDKFIYALPMFLFFALALSFISGVFNKNANSVDLDIIYGELTASGAFICTMLFSVMAIAVLIVFDTIKKIKSGYSIKKQAFKFLPVVIILIVCGCMFAPSAKSTMIAKTSETQSETFTSDFYNDFTMYAVLSNGDKDTMKEYFAGKTAYDEFDYFVEQIEQSHALFIELLGTVPRSLRRNWAFSNSATNIKYGLLAQAQPKATAALAFGYYACYIVILLSGAWVCVYLSDTEKYKAASKTLQAIIGTLVIIALALSVVTICVVNATMDTANITYFSMSVGGGLIAALVMFVAFAVASGLISGRFKDAPKNEVSIEQEAA